MNIRSLKKSARTEKHELFDIYRLTVGEANYKIAITRKRANKRTIIKCSDSDVAFIRYTPIAGGFSQPAVTAEASISVAELLEKDTVCFLVISGKPLDIHRLDNGRISSAKAYSNRSVDTQKLYVMSKRAFAQLEKEWLKQEQGKESCGWK